MAGGDPPAPDRAGSPESLPADVDEPCTLIGDHLNAGELEAAAAPSLVASAANRIASVLAWARSAFDCSACCSGRKRQRKPYPQVIVTSWNTCPPSILGSIRQSES